MSKNKINENKRKIMYEEVTTKINELGEVKEDKIVRTIKVPREEDYIKIYIKHINYLNNVPEGLDNVIYSLLKRINYNNEIIINSAVKRQIAKELGKKFNTINQYITKLVKLDILIRVDTGIYVLNPIFFGKGNWKNILELREKLEIQIVYEEGEYRIYHKFKKNNKD